MGDILEDVKMVNEEQHKHILKVGFLNDLELLGHLKDKYLQTFDFVIANDGSLNSINFILNALFNKERVHQYNNEEAVRIIERILP